MSYLLDKKTKRKKLFYFISLCIILLVLFYFRLNISNGFAYASHKLFRPVLIFGNDVGGKFSSIGSYFAYKKSLELENENLKSQLNQNKTAMSNYNSILSENIELKGILGRKNERTT